jgi:5'-nucleotidase (lipoprotein e(P4) family)
MKASFYFLISSFISLFLHADNKQDDRTLAVLYSQTSAEHMASSIQTYQSMQSLLPIAIEDKSWNALVNIPSNPDNPPAIILDVDDTVLDNSPYEARVIKTGKNYPHGWDEWCNEAQAEAIPGVIDFLHEAIDRGVTIFYVTNRKSYLEQATRTNFKKLGIPLEDSFDNLLTRNENGWDSNKTSRRELIAKNYRVIFQVGDNLGDFIDEAENKSSPKQRKEVVNKYKERWGKTWFVIENPTYGDWEGALYNFQFDQPQSDILDIRNNALNEK